jgi:hypothetical protein
MKLYSPEGVACNAEKSQRELLLAAGFTEQAPEKEFVELSEEELAKLPKNKREAYAAELALHKKA